MRKFLIVPAIALAFAAVQPALARDDDLGRRLNVPQDQWLTPAQVKEKLVAAGYRVQEIESDDGAYEVEMVDKDGTRIETRVHPATGEMLPGDDD